MESWGTIRVRFLDAFITLLKMHKQISSFALLSKSGWIKSHFDLCLMQRAIWIAQMQSWLLKWIAPNLRWTAMKLIFMIEHPGLSAFYYINIQVVSRSHCALDNNLGHYWGITAHIHCSFGNWKNSKLQVPYQAGYLWEINKIIREYCFAR